MKAKNMVVGQRVKVKALKVGETNSFFKSCHEDELEGEIVDIDLGSGLDVKVSFDDGSDGWGNHKQIRKVKGA